MKLIVWGTVYGRNNGENFTVVQVDHSPSSSQGLEMNDFLPPLPNDPDKISNSIKADTMFRLSEPNKRHYDFKENAVLCVSIVKVNVTWNTSLPYFPPCLCLPPCFKLFLRTPWWCMESITNENMLHGQEKIIQSKLCKAIRKAGIDCPSYVYAGSSF